MYYFTCYCCNHDDPDFNLTDFLPGKLYLDDSSLGPIKRKKPNIYRKPQDHDALDNHIVSWLQKASKLHGGIASYDILDFSEHQKLVHAPPKSLSSPLDVAQLLGESSDWAAEWAAPLFLMVKNYDQEQEWEKVSVDTTKRA
ncbi:hypothetical protein C0992_005179 [Termitomyces sp. T32_za158]|nr:hypothetical protein C0992_005179 [Termitomyces sp. T32_za158]